MRSVRFVLSLLLALCINLVVDRASADDLYIGPSQSYTLPAGQTLVHDGAIVVEGEITIYGTLRQTGDLIVRGGGRFTVDGGEYHIEGLDTHIGVSGNGTMAFRNGALFHYVMTYYKQHSLTTWDNGRVELVDSTVKCDGVLEAIKMYDNSSYEAVNTTYVDWKTWYMFDQSSLSLRNIDYGGDIVVYDAAKVKAVNTSLVMPWLTFGEGAVVDYQFPSAPSQEIPVSAKLDDEVPGVSGIPWSFEIENCNYIYWGINPYPGSDVTIRNSDLTMVLYRFTGQQQHMLDGIMRNRSHYDDLPLPASDRSLRLVNTSVEWWKVDIIEQCELNADSIVFSEMMVKQNAVGHITNSICEGQTIHLGAQDDAFVQFDNGEVWTYVSVWHNATMVLRDSLVDHRKGEYVYQTENIAHHNARLYSLNTTYGYDVDPSESLPQAADAALVMFLSVDLPAEADPGDKVELSGSAWIDAGPDSSVTFGHYELQVAPEGSSDWTVIKQSTDVVRESLLGTWDTTGMASGSYRVRLVLWVEGDKATDHPTYQFPAEAEIRLNDVETPDQDQQAEAEPESPSTPQSISGCGCIVGSASNTTSRGLLLLLGLFVAFAFRSTASTPGRRR